MRALLAIAMLLALPGCQALQPPGVVLARPQPDWRQVATEKDRERLREWRSTFVSAIAQARAAGHGDDIVREGFLLEPDAALPGGRIPDGLYRCRTIKVGAKSEGLLNFVTYPYFSCRIEQQGQYQRFTKLTGSQRQIGLIFPGDGIRQAFLGTLVLGDEDRAMQYGSDPERDVAGWVEQTRPNQWRLVMPQPNFESRLDVLELRPEP